MALPNLPAINPELLSSRLAGLSTWVLIAAAGYACALLAIEFLPRADDVQARARPLTPRPAGPADNAARQQLDQITAAHLFGREAAAPTRVERVEAPPQESIDKSPLNIRLAGIFATGDPQAGHVVISGGREDAVVAVGGELKDQSGKRATLEEVYPFHIVINNRGRRERIDLPKPELGAGALASAGGTTGGGSTGNRSGGSSRAQPVSSRSASASNGAAGASGGAGAVDVNSLPQTPGALRDYLVRNPATMQQLMDVRPHRENGRVVGYALNPKQDATLMRNFGIEPGDVVVSLNGVSLDNQRRSLKALRQLVSAKQLDMTVMRNGAEIPISISLQ